MSHREYDVIIVEVPPLHPFPTVGYELSTASPMTGMRYFIKVTRIVAIEWGASGSVIVAIKGVKRTQENTGGAEKHE